MFYQEKTRRQRARRGGAMVEFALILPVFVLIAMGTIETCRVLYLRQALRIAAYESARLAITPGIDESAVRDIGELFLSDRHLQGGVIELSSPLSGVQYGDLLTVSAAIPIDANVLAGTWFFTEDLLRESVTVMVES